MVVDFQTYKEKADHDKMRQFFIDCVNSPSISNDMKVLMMKLLEVGNE